MNWWRYNPRHGSQWSFLFFSYSFTQWWRVLSVGNAWRSFLSPSIRQAVTKDLTSHPHVYVESLREWSGFDREFEFESRNTILLTKLSSHVSCLYETVNQGLFNVERTSGSCVLTLQTLPLVFIGVCKVDTKTLSVPFILPAFSRQLWCRKNDGNTQSRECQCER